MKAMLCGKHIADNDLLEVSLKYASAWEDDGSTWLDPFLVADNIIESINNGYKVSHDETRLLDLCKEATDQDYEMVFLYA